MQKKYIPYVILIGSNLFIWISETNYAGLDLYAFYWPCAIFIIELWGKAKITRDLIITCAVVMTFAVIAQLIGLGTVWRLPEQTWIYKDWVLFPIEEWMYWHGAMSLAVLIYKHLEAYHDDLVNDLYVWINGVHCRSTIIWTCQIQVQKDIVRTFITSLIFAPVMFNIENYSILKGFFKYYDSQITFYIWEVPFEGLLMYYLVPYFFHITWLTVKLITDKLCKNILFRVR